jgi:hypothetical protein
MKTAIKAIELSGRIFVAAFVDTLIVSWPSRFSIKVAIKPAIKTTELVGRIFIAAFVDTLIVRQVGFR